MEQNRKLHLMQLEWKPGCEEGKCLAGKAATALKVKTKPGAEGEWNAGKTTTVKKEARPRNQIKPHIFAARLQHALHHPRPMKCM